MVRIVECHLANRLRFHPATGSSSRKLKERIRDAQVRAGVAVNRELILLYWGIGREILRRQQLPGWGAKVIDTLARDPHRDFPDMTGFSAP
jgi:hypothetical protein